MIKHTAALLFFVAVVAHAQNYPTKPIRVIVPFTPGSQIDVMARPVCQKLAELLGQPVVIENRAGAGGTVGAATVAKSSPDGYTLLIHSSAYAVNPALYENLPYELKDFVEVAPLARFPYVLVVAPSAGIKSVAELIAGAKAKPGQTNFGSAGTGSGTHLVAEKFKLAARIDAVHIPYKGGPEATADTMTGRITYWFPPIGIALPHVQGGKLLALGISSRERSPLLPGVPTIGEAALPGFDDSIWYGIWAPAGTPSATVDKLASEIGRALASEELRDRFAKLGAEAMKMTPREFAGFVRGEVDSAARVVKAANIKLQ